MLTRLYRVEQPVGPPSDPDPQSPSTQSQLDKITEYSVKCVEAALELINLLGETPESERPVWWYSVLCKNL